MFSLREFIKNGLLKAVGHMADYQIILNAAGWHEKGVLQNSDLEEVQAAIDAQNVQESVENFESDDLLDQELMGGDLDIGNELTGGESDGN